MVIDGLWPHSKKLFDASTDDKMKLKTPNEAVELIKNMVVDDYAILHDSSHIPSKKSLLELTFQGTLLAQKKLLLQNYLKLSQSHSINFHNNCIPFN